MKDHNMQLSQEHMKIAQVIAKKYAPLIKQDLKEAGLIKGNGQGPETDVSVMAMGPVATGLILGGIISVVASVAIASYGDSWGPGSGGKDDGGSEGGDDNGGGSEGGDTGGGEDGGGSEGGE
jgi:uncharacterized membrane protein YgcG